MTIFRTSRQGRPLAAALSALGLTLLVGAGALPGSATAAPIYLLDATNDGLPPQASFSNVAFSLTFEDLNSDQRFSLNELLAFTGVSDPLGPLGNHYNILLEIPTLPGITGNGPGWLFGDDSGMLADFRASAATFTPFINGPLAGSVPEPGSAALLLAALLGLAVVGTPKRLRANRGAAVAQFI